jgi:hypothetical protein
MRGAGPVAFADTATSTAASAREFDAQFPPLPCRLDIVGRTQERAERDTGEHVTTEILRSLAKVAFMQRVGLGQHDQPIGVEVIDERRKLQVDEAGAEALQSPAGGIERCDISRPGRAVGAETGNCVAFMKLADHADRHPVEARRECRPVIGYRPVGRGRVQWVVASQRLHHDGAIFDCAGQRAAMVERVRQRKDATPADPAIGRLQADDAIIGGGAADRTAGVRAHRRRA